MGLFLASRLAGTNDGPLRFEHSSVNRPTGETWDSVSAFGMFGKWVLRKFGFMIICPSDNTKQQIHLLPQAPACRECYVPIP